MQDRADSEVWLTDDAASWIDAVAAGPSDRWQELAHVPVRVRALTLVAGETLRLPPITVGVDTRLHVRWVPALPAISGDGMTVAATVAFDDQVETLATFEVSGPVAFTLPRFDDLSLGRWAGRAVTIGLTVGSGPRGDALGDWLGVVGLAVGDAERIPLLLARSNRQWRSANEVAHFSAVYRDRFYSPQPIVAGSAQQAAPLEPEPWDIARPAHVQQDTLAALAGFASESGETAFAFAQRMLTAALGVVPPNFVERARQLAARRSPDRSLRLLALCCGSARVEAGILAELHDPVDVFLFDLNADLLAEAAARMPAHHRVRRIVGDVNLGLPAAGPFDVIVCVSALHHVVELESLLAWIGDALAEDGEFWSIGEYVGPNGCRLGPRDWNAANGLFRSLPERLRYNRLSSRCDESLPSPDCSMSSFEAIRAEELYPLLQRYLVPEQVYLRNCLLWRLLDPTYAENYDLTRPDDVQTLRRLVAAELDRWRAGGRCTELHGVFRPRRLALAAGVSQTDSVRFVCNVCGDENARAVGEFGREAATCSRCGSTTRMRAMVHLLSIGVLGRSVPLPDFPEDRQIHGVGLSDWVGYAKPLAQKFDYRNTFYHRQPFLDVTKPPPELHGTLDFVIASDVFEHVLPPVERAFVGAAALLRPGGCLVFSVPYGFDERTVEHFPEAFDIEVRQVAGEWQLHNRKRDGTLEVHRNLVFHGGPGQTVEMRLFCLADIQRMAAAAGFSSCEVLADPVWAYGIHDPHPWSRPMLLRKGP